MRKEKFFLAGAALAAVVLLGGCGNNKPAESPKNIPSPQSSDQKSAGAPSNDAAQEKAALPESVSAKPGNTVDEEVKNIDNDMKSIDDNNLESGMTDKDLGV